MGNGDFYGFELDGDGRFLLGDFTVTHNTTCIEEITKRLPAHSTCLVVAFNKDIAEELSGRVRTGCEVMTTNGLGHRAVTMAFKSKKPESDAWVRSILRREAYFPHRSQTKQRSAIEQIVARAKNTLASGREINHFIDRLRVDPFALLDESELSLGTQEERQADGRQRIIRTTLGVLDICKREAPASPIIDYNDQLWLPSALDLPVGQWDVVIVDEAQDLNRAQHELLFKAVAPGGRFIGVGDPRQAIYSWRGAEVDSFDRLSKHFDATELLLPVTYRCGKRIVEQARELVPDFEFGPSNEEGEVLRQKELDVSLLEPGDFVISRKNAPLLALCLRAIGAGKPAKLAGRDLGRELTRQVEDAIEEAGDGASPGRVRALALATIDAQLRLRSEGDDDSEDSNLLDRRACLVHLFDAKITPERVIEALRLLCVDRDNLRGQVVFCSTHRAKGLEADRVWLLESTFSATSLDEQNLLYVAMTRARKTLVFVEKDT